MGELLFKDEVFVLQGAIFEVSREMGIDFLEAVYQECLAKEFTRVNLPYVRHPNLALSYKGDLLSQVYVPDFICYDSIIVELKVAQSINEAHRAQILNYLKATNLRLGLIVNYGAHPKAQVERYAL